MELLSRLIDVLRANFHFGPSDDPSDGYSYHRGSGQSTGNGTQTGYARSDCDPELAGYYANLEVPYGSDLATVRRAWRRLVRKYHPDLYSSDLDKRRIATELTQELNRAYEELAKQLEK